MHLATLVAEMSCDTGETMLHKETRRCFLRPLLTRIGSYFVRSTFKWTGHSSDILTHDALFGPITSTHPAI